MAAQHQHYVPQLLLRGFLSSDAEKAAKEQVHVMDMQGGQQFTTSIGNIMGERRYNDFWIDDGVLASVEPAAGRIESHVAPLVERIRAERRLLRSDEEFSSLALLMAFQFIRTKIVRLLPERLSEQLRQQVAAMGLDPAKIQNLPPTDEESLKREHARQQVENLETYVATILPYEFFLVTAPEGEAFYIGDHPVVLHNDEEPRGMMGRLGLGAHYIQIYLPLASDVMLCAYDKAVLGQLMKFREGELNDIRSDALARFRRGEMTAAQMKQALEGLKDNDPIGSMIEAIRGGEPVGIEAEGVKFYNSLQCSQAHRFVIDPRGDFAIGNEVRQNLVASKADESKRDGQFA